MDCSLPGSSVHGIFQARVLEWVAISFSRGPSWPRNWTWVSHIAGRRFTIWATREAHSFLWLNNIHIYMYHNFIHSSLGGHLGCFHVLAIVILRWILGYTYLLQFWFPRCVRPAVGLLGHLAVLPWQASLVAQTVKSWPTMRETRVRFLGREDPLEKEMAIHSSTLAWKIPWTEEPDRLQPMGSIRVGHDFNSFSLSMSLFQLKKRT